MKKIFLSFILICALLLTGCNSSKEYINLVESSLNNFENIVNGELDIKMKYVINIKNKNLDNKVSILGEVNLEQFSESKAKMDTKFSALGFEELIGMYLFEDNNNIYLATQLPVDDEGTLEWYRTLSTDEQMNFDNLDLKTIIKDDDSVKVGTEKIDNKDYVLFDVEVTFDELLRIMNLFYGDSYQPSEEELELYRDLPSSTIKLYIDEDAEQIKKLEINATESVNGILEKVIKEGYNSNSAFISQFSEYKSPNEDVQISMEEFIFSIEINNIGKVSDFDIPEEVLNSEIIELESE